MTEEQAAKIIELLEKLITVQNTHIHYHYSNGGMDIRPPYYTYEVQRYG